MCDSDSQCCITRVVDGEGHELQLAQLQVVMQRIQAALRDVPSVERVYLSNALLSFAIKAMTGRLLCDQDLQRTTAVLMRMNAVVPAPPSDVSQVTAPMMLHG